MFLHHEIFVNLLNCLIRPIGRNLMCMKVRASTLPEFIVFVPIPAQGAYQSHLRGALI